MKREILAVTQADIDQAHQWRMDLVKLTEGRCGGVTNTNCPVAAALARLHPAVRSVKAMPDGLSLRNGEGPTWALPSRRMVRFMSRWDRKWLASPARFLVVWED